MARLPNPGGDDGNWGEILNDYLTQTLGVDGVIKDNTISSSKIQSGAVSLPKLAASGASAGKVLSTDGANLVWSTPSSGSTSDATTASKGVVQLTGDLGGTADNPTVPGLANKANTTHTHAISDVTNLQTSLNQKADTTSLASVATSGAYTDLSNKPVIPTQFNPIAGTNVSLSGAYPNITFNAASGTGTTDLTATRTATAVTIESSTGADATVAAADTSNAGVLSAADKTKLDSIASGAQVNSVSSVAGKTGAVSLVKGDIGLGNVDNTSDANKPISSATQTALSAKEPTITAGTTAQYYRGDKSFQTLDKSAVGLANVDNVSDANKPISTATQTALNAKADVLSTINAQTGTAYTLAITDINKFITLTNSSAITVTVPSNASVGFSVGTRIVFAQMGNGQVTFVASSGVSVYGDPGLKIAVQYGGAELVKLDVDTWILVGRLAA